MQLSFLKSRTVPCKRLALLLLTALLGGSSSLSSTAQTVLGTGGIRTTEERKPSPKFLGKELPPPPEQKSAWDVPHSHLPTNYITASTALFELGMADPRGCDYREIEVGTGSIWRGDGGVVKTHGWVFSSNGQRFAVCWNGLVYPATSVGAAADWRADALACIQHAGSQWRRAVPEHYAVSFENCSRLKGCLLLRLGEPKLAGDLWLAMQMRAQRDLNAAFRLSGATNALAEPKAELSTNDPFLEWASDWAWNLFERSLCAHMREDDKLALAGARLLASGRARVESEAQRRGFERRQTNTAPWDGKYQDYLGFLGPLPTLLNDQERRAARKESRALSPSEIAKVTDQNIRILAWIDALDEVKVRQWGQPGGLGGWEGDPVVAGLLREGQSAITPLLQCLGGDCANRLTRSISFGRDFHQDRMLHFVGEPIVSVLLKLMNTTDVAVGFDHRAIYGRRGSNAVLAAQFHYYWQQFGKLSAAERWYRKLTEDGAGQAAWADALENIVRSEKRGTNTSPATLNGEALRSKKSPTVTELLLRRGAAITESAPVSNAFAIRDAVDFLLKAERWEFSLPLLSLASELQAKIAANYDGNRNAGSADPQNSTSIAALAMLRARHGDEKGLAEYAEWIQGARPTALRSSGLDALEPFWRFPNHPELRAAAKEMFGRTNSPWGTLAWLLEPKGAFPSSRNPLASPALIIPEFRALVLNELANRTIAGEAINRGGGNLEVRYAAVAVSYGARKDTEGLPVGAKFDFRRCDVVAEQLATIQGFPPISLLWSESKRDEAVAATIKLLTFSGARLKALEKPSGWSPAFDPPLVQLEDE